ncbi:MAG: AmmeMemoRadiSam system protein B [Candidatus Loosdrechtia sp.]|uniref:protein MEMO1 n=1 Tax=Candidatus Loosdrechtia sp. TaxID=3101272 RepID=UPI003A69C3F1|nr:MAG: AmmeMemoRadiSam system protein B [Candidatus Jettenia sp. AMX2]
MKQFVFLKTFLLFTLLVFAIPIRIVSAQEIPHEVWEPQVAGRFYPVNEDALRDQITTFFKNIGKQPAKGKPIALITPHAGYIYSGQVAAYGYHAIRNYGFKRVILLATSHFIGGRRFRGISVLKVKNFKTPLGLIPVDQDACNYLLNADTRAATNSSKKAHLFGSYEGAYQGEYSMETQLPFLQMTLDDFTLVPMVVGILMNEDFDQFAEIIRPLLDEKTLIVVSSDFTHYGEAFSYVPFKTDIERNIKLLDSGAFEKILSRDFNGLKQYKKQTGINICGIIPIALLLKLLPDDARGEVLSYDTSGRQSGNFSFSVSYTSIVFIHE